MITITTEENITKGKSIVVERKLQCFHSIDKCKKFIIPYVKEMKLAKREKRKPTKRIDGVSYDTKSE